MLTLASSTIPTTCSDFSFRSSRPWESLHNTNLGSLISSSLLVDETSTSRVVFATILLLLSLLWC